MLLSFDLTELGTVSHRVLFQHCLNVNRSHLVQNTNSCSKMTRGRIRDVHQRRERRQCTRTRGFLAKMHECVLVHSVRHNMCIEVSPCVEFQPDAVESGGRSSSPRKDYSLIPMTPLIAPGAHGSPLMTWGEIEGTPADLGAVSGTNRQCEAKQ